ncbi:MAG: hypothetical protein KDB27_17385 [Planctomycetales bacterium]|nr:hypothetical protein [Planctomycetales bacterium]
MTAGATTAAQLASTEKNVAAFTSRQAGSQYGLNVRADAIEDNEHNVTRFAVISREPAERTGDDKTSFMFELVPRTWSIRCVFAGVGSGIVNCAGSCRQVLHRRSLKNLRIVQSFTRTLGLSWENH